MTATRDDLRALADAVLFEGYMLYPYRANDPKNHVRWQFGVLAPPAFIDVDPSERSHLQVDCLLEGHDVRVTAIIRFLHVQRRTVHSAEMAAVDALDVGAATYLPWDEAVVREAILSTALPGIEVHSDTRSIQIEGGSEHEKLTTADGTVAGYLVRERLPLTAEVFLDAEALPGPYGVRRLRVRLENTTPWPPNAGGRGDALRHALVAAHVMLTVEGGAFMSMIDPPEWAHGYAEICHQVGVFPVLAGPPGDRRTVLAAPIILYDHPQLAPESASQFCDATEMDEMLTLRTLTLTEAEKRQARGSDPRAAATRRRDRQPAARADGPPARRDPFDDECGPPGRGGTGGDHALVECRGRGPVRSGYRRGHDQRRTRRSRSGGPAASGTASRRRAGHVPRRPQGHGRGGAQATSTAMSTSPSPSTTSSSSPRTGGNPHGRFLYFAPDEVEPNEVP